MPKKLTTEEFVKRAIDTHHNKYSYSKSIYKGGLVEIIIICPTHGEFKQLPKNHLKGSICSYCANESRGVKSNISRTLTTAEFIKKARQVHGDTYDYSKVDFINIKTKVIIKCIEHGEFSQRSSDHLAGKRCKICVDDKLRLSNEEFIEKANLVHNNNYTYSATTYLDCYSSVIVTCKKHGDFSQQAYAHIQGNGCPICNTSKGELAIVKFLETNNINYVSQKKFDGCKNKRHLPFDFYLPELNLCIEYDGEQHFRRAGYDKDGSILKRVQRNDKIKNEYCKTQGIQLLRIGFDEDINNELCKIQLL